MRPPQKASSPESVRPGLESARARGAAADEGHAARPTSSLRSRARRVHVASPRDALRGWVIGSRGQTVRCALLGSRRSGPPTGRWSKARMAPPVPPRTTRRPLTGSDTMDQLWRGQRAGRGITRRLRVCGSPGARCVERVPAIGGGGVSEHVAGDEHHRPPGVFVVGDRRASSLAVAVRQGHPAALAGPRPGDGEFVDDDARLHVEQPRRHSGRVRGVGDGRHDAVEAGVVGEEIAARVFPPIAAPDLSSPATAHVLAVTSYAQIVPGSVSLRVAQAPTASMPRIPQPHDVVRGRPMTRPRVASRL